ncbi:hypothetical protein, partial [Paraburkholderia sp. SIMBA_030]|uniref:hypothetical protein n=1 Tax=Paraburkholderia sp. SIMBA_030 TaxID=3085773 RepID=UPI00397ACF91
GCECDRAQEGFFHDVFRENCKGNRRRGGYKRQRVVGFRPTRGGIIEISVKGFCKSLSNLNDNLRFMGFKTQSLLPAVNSDIF